MLDNKMQYQYNAYLANQPNTQVNSVRQSGISNTQNSPRFGSIRDVFSFPNIHMPFITSIKDPKDKQMYKEISNNLENNTDKAQLKKLLKTGKLLSRKSNDKSSTLENLYKIMKTQRVQGLENNKVLSETVRTLADPFIINQTFGKMPDFLVGSILADQNRNKINNGMGLNNKLSPNFNQLQTVGPSAALTPQDLNVEASGTCVASSIEFNLADKKPAEYARYVAGLTSPAMAVNVNIKTKDIAENIFEAQKLLKQFKVEHKIKDWNNIEVTLRPDPHALTRAQVQESQYKVPKSRSSIDALMQSTFMTLGSAKTYDSFTDNRAGDDVTDPKGLVEDEKNFVESTVDNDGGKTSVVYQNVDDNGYLVGYNTNYNTVQNHLLGSLNAGKNVIIGITEFDNTKKNIGGHEITVIDAHKNKNGELMFVCNDTDDDYDGAVEIKAKDLIPKIHHAGIPNKVLGISNEDNDNLSSVKVLQELKNPKHQDQNNNENLPPYSPSPLPPYPRDHQ